MHSSQGLWAIISVDTIGANVHYQARKDVLNRQDYPIDPFRKLNG
jgi:hypothetical protein